MGGDTTKVEPRHPQHLPRSRVLVARRDRRPRAPLQFLERRCAPLRARRRLRDNGRAVERITRLDPGHLRRRTRPGRRHRGRAAAAASRWRCASSAARRMHRRSARRRADLRGISRGLDCIRERSGEAVVVTPPSYRFDYRDRGGSDRGSRAAAWLSTAFRRSHRSRRRVMRAQPRGASVACMRCERCWRRSVTRKSSTTASSTPVGKPISRQRRADRGAEPDREPDVRNAQHITRWLGRQRSRYNLNRKTARVRVFEVGRVYRRDAATVDGPLTVRWRGPAASGRRDWRTGLPTKNNGATVTRWVDFYDVKGDVERLFAPRRISFERTEHPALHPGRAARMVHRRPARRRGIGELHPRLQQKYELPKPAVVFEVDLESLLARDLPTVRDVPKFQPLQRDIAILVDDRVEYADIEAAIDARSREDSRLSALAEVRLFDVYRPRQAVSGGSEAVANTLLNKEKSLAIRLFCKILKRRSAILRPMGQSLPWSRNSRAVRCPPTAMKTMRDDRQMTTGFKFPELPTAGAGGRAGDRGVKT